MVQDIVAIHHPLHYGLSGLSIIYCMRPTENAHRRVRGVRECGFLHFVSPSHTIPPRVPVRGPRECPTVHTEGYRVGGFNLLTCFLVVVVVVVITTPVVVVVVAVALLCSGRRWHHACRAVSPSVHDRLQQDFRGFEADAAGDGVGDERARVEV